MSEYKEYTVTTESLERTDSLWDDLLRDGSNLTTIPIRTVEVANSRPNNPHNTSYWLTDKEADFLREDPRVVDVQNLDSFKPIKLAFQTGNFDKTSTESGPKANWGLLRHSLTTNIYGNSLSDPGGTYDYVLDGTGVDVVIIDSGIQANHPEFLNTDNSGASRVNPIDWFALSGISGSMPSGFYQDFDGHGTHVAATVAGRTFGWAKNAQIYSIKLEGLKSPSDTGGGFDVATAFDVLIGWHNNKTNGRPTVVINSWGYGIYHRADSESFSFGLDESDILYAINGGAYRGVTWSGATLSTARGHTGALKAPSTYLYPFRVSSVDFDIFAGAQAGILFCNAAGNEFMKIDVQGGVDYNNYINTDFGVFYYHRGGTPGASITASDSVFTVGAMDHQTTAQGEERKANFSNSGPGVTVYAAGSRIISAISQVNDDNSNTQYFLNNSFKQQLLSGTSMAAPQIAGISALVYQMHPDWEPRQVVNFVKSRALPALYTSGQSNDYTNQYSVHGGETKIAYVPMSSQRKYSFFRATV